MPAGETGPETVMVVMPLRLESSNNTVSPWKNASGSALVVRFIQFDEPAAFQKPSPAPKVEPQRRRLPAPLNVTLIWFAVAWSSVAEKRLLATVTLELKLPFFAPVKLIRR